MADSTLISSGLVRGAYRSSQSLTGGPADRATQAGESEATSFAEALKSASADAVRTVREADVAAQAGMTGQLDTQSVVEATVALEATVKVAVSMRDKFVEAYKEVLRMPI
ncbi:flagellar hook-basal body complex protein FliE [Tranquillimonas alkanivorans]|uniref:Flagellar hook-basal body complex protein FliE n=1 Tax=Tranquillimonas alkanivorans TaxID=441119 RepID=A0A1I5S378_9RHOB|nr:flagellar hook-basal body complex protein FliE [Tranquillimonas alkanivorans]SFP65159.1 flagellar hook-basal body complex protein FliE [Tranquillimonas alkanivorans]